MCYNRKLAMVTTLVLFILVGCKRRPLTPPVIHDNQLAQNFPRLSVTANYDLPPGDFRWPSQDDVSVDGNYLAFILSDDTKESLWVYSFQDNHGSPMYDISRSEVTAGRLLLVPIGWTDDNNLVFARQGTQPDGPHQGQRGILIYVADPTKDLIKEVCWLPNPNPNDYIKQIGLQRETSTILIHMGNSLWQLSLLDGSVKAINNNLPSYDGLFYLRGSANYEAFVYELFEPNKRGIYLLDVSTGAEQCLVQTADTFNFSPQWSPDGRHIAFYNAPAKEGMLLDHPDTDLGEQFDIVQGEDAPAPIATGIRVIKPSGQEIVSLTMPESDAKTALFTWSEDGQHLAFFKAEALDTPYHELLFNLQSLHIADFDGNIYKLADMPKDILFVDVIQVSQDSAYYLTYDQQQTDLWLAKVGEIPQKLNVPADIQGDNGSFAPVYPLPTFKTSILVNYNTGDSTYYLQVWQNDVEILAKTNTGSCILPIQNRVLLIYKNNQNNRLTIFTPEQLGL